MELIPETAFQLRIDREGVRIDRVLYRGDILISPRDVEPLDSLSLEQRRTRWLGESPGALWIIVSDQPFDRDWYEGWQSWAHLHGGGFEHMSLRAGSQHLPFILKERPLCRALVRSDWSPERNIWRP